MERKCLNRKTLFDLEQKALQLQMNPHFIFNSLNSIQSFIIITTLIKQPCICQVRATDEIDISKFSVKICACQDEIKVLTYYMDIETRFDNNLIIK